MCETWTPFLLSFFCEKVQLAAFLPANKTSDPGRPRVRQTPAQTQECNGLWEPSSLVLSILFLYQQQPTIPYSVSQAGAYLLSGGVLGGTFPSSPGPLVVLSHLAVNFL